VACRGADTGLFDVSRQLPHFLDRFIDFITALAYQFIFPPFRRIPHFPELAAIAAVKLAISIICR
jgi:hypothetical protein